MCSKQKFVPLVEQNLIFPSDGHFSSVDFNQPLQLPLGFFFPVDAVLLQGSLCLGLPRRTPQLLLEARDDVLSHFGLDLLLAQQPVQLPDLTLEVTELGQEVLLKDAVRWSRLRVPQGAVCVGQLLHFHYCITTFKEMQWYFVLVRQ